MEKSNQQTRGYGLIRWLNDGNRVSIIDMKWIEEPKVDVYSAGMCGLSKYPGYPGLWQFRILKVGGKMSELKKWMNMNIGLLMDDPTDKFLKGNESGKGNDMIEEAGTCRVKNERSVEERNSDEDLKVKKCKSDQSPGQESDKGHADMKEEAGTCWVKKKRSLEERNSDEDLQVKKCKSDRSPEKKLQHSDYLHRSPQSSSRASADDSIHARLKKLEDENAKLKKKYKRAEERITALENHKKLPQSKEDFSVNVLETKLEEAKSAKKETESVEKETKNDKEQEFSADELEKSVKGIHGDINIVKHFTFKIFTNEELRTCTRTGKKPSKVVKL